MESVESTTAITTSPLSSPALSPLTPTTSPASTIEQQQQQQTPKENTTMSAAVASANIAAAAAAISAASMLDIKTKVDVMQSNNINNNSSSNTQKIKKLVRRNASDKLKLIQMVHDNPILWDSRLPNFKGAEEEKNRAWEYIGKEFNAPGRRVARAFKSLRESYRRELAHVKLMGSGFKPKWSLYEAMDFLRDVIRERKGGSHAAEQAAIGLNLSALAQHMHHNNNNNMSKSIHKINSMHSSPFTEAALNLSKCSALNMSQDDYYYFVKPEMDLSNQNGSNSAADGQQQQQQQHHHNQQQQQQHPLPAHQHQQQLQQQQQHNMQNDTCVSSTRNDCTQNSTSFDDMDASSLRSGDEASLRNATALSHEGSDEVEELDAIDADFPYPLILDSNSTRSCAGGVVGPGGVINGAAGAGHHHHHHQHGTNKRRRKNASNGEAGGDIDDMDDVDDCDGDYEGQMLQQHRHLRQQQNLGNLGSGGGGSGMGMDMPQPQTVREVLNSKFCGFISAKLNSMEDTEADNLMNKILMLLVQTQGNDLKQ